MFHVVKIGGKLIDNTSLLKLALDRFHALQGRKILIHGGGTSASLFSKKIGIRPKIIEGRRVTDNQTLEVVVMTYAGLINKTVVAKLQSIGCNALGLSGADANLICVNRRMVGNINYGHVGDIDQRSIHIHTLQKLIKSGFIPVFCAITHNGKGELLNTNADNIACALAIILSERGKEQVSLHYCFEKKGVLQDLDEENSFFRKISISEYKILKKEQLITHGMIPKLDSAFSAVKKGVDQVSIGHPRFLHHSTEKTILCL